MQTWGDSNLGFVLPPSAAVQSYNVPRNPLSFSGAQNWSTSHSLFGNLNPFGIQNRRTLWQGDNFTVNVLSRSARQSPVFVCSLSLCLWIPWLWSSYSEGEKKTTTKESPVYSPPPTPLFVITKEQTHIKHTQGAEAVIAVSAVLLWVAGDDNISHGFIYIFFLFMSSPNHGQLGIGEYLWKDLFSPIMNIYCFFSRGVTHVSIWAQRHCSYVYWMQVFLNHPNCSRKLFPHIWKI